MRNKRLLALLTAVSVMAAGITGCQSSGAEDTPPVESAAETENAGEVTEDDGERISIEIVSGDAVELPPEGANFMDKALSEAIGADVKFTVLGSGNDYATALNVRITGGDVPDIFAIPVKTDESNTKIISKDTMYKYADDGVIMCLDPYLDQLKAVLEFTGGVQDPDLYNGQAYLIPVKKEDTIWTANMMRNDWMEAVGGTEPATPEELLELCKKFTFEDPDGNGKNDTYGLSGPGLKVFDTILNTYGGSVSNDILIKDGQVTSSLMSPHMKDGLEMCKAFVDAGVVDPDMVANTSEVANDKAIQGLYGMTNASFAGLMRQSYQDKVHAVNPNAEWKLTEALEGPDGKYCGAIDATDTQARYVISKQVEGNSAKLNKVIELLNYLASEEGQRTVCYGQEGEHYNVVDGQVVATDRMGAETAFAWAYQLEGRDNDAYLKVKFPEWKELLPYANQYPRYEVYNSAISAPEGFYTEDFNKYVSEEMTKFIYGQREIQEYDVFLEELESMFHFSDYLESAQEQLTRFGFID